MSCLSIHFCVCLFRQYTQSPISTCHQLPSSSCFNGAPRLHQKHLFFNIASLSPTILSTRNKCLLVNLGHVLVHPFTNQVRVLVGVRLHIEAVFIDNVQSDRSVFHVFVIDVGDSHQIHPFIKMNAATLCVPLLSK